MKMNKVMVVMLALAMTLSVFVIMKDDKSFTVTATTPGIDDWGTCTTTDLEYDPDTWVSITMNTTGLDPNTIYFLYKPRYNCSSSGDKPAATADWMQQVITSGDLNAKITTGSTTLWQTATMNGLIKLDRAGMWILDDDSTHSGNDTSSYGSFFWVNATTSLTIGSIADVKYNDSGSITVTVTEGGEGVDCYIDLLDPNNNTVFHKWTGAEDGVYDFGIKHNLSMVGTYTVRAYVDTDEFSSTWYTYQDEIDGTYNGAWWNGNAGATGYSDTYGANFSNATEVRICCATGEGWNYTYCGPWDPPEKNATLLQFDVDVGEPTIALTNTTAYWGLNHRIDINATDGEGLGILGATIKLKRHGSSRVYYTGNVDGTPSDGTTGQWFFFNDSGTGNYSFEMKRVDSPNDYNWSVLVNGTWDIFVTQDINGDGTDEFNKSKSFSVSGSKPPVRLIIDNDGQGTSTDKKVNIPAYTDDLGTTPSIDIYFSIYGRTLTGNGEYYGNDPVEDWRNISITGDILHPVTPYGGNPSLTYVGSGQWLARVTPTKPGGTITLTIDWKGSDNGTATETINIINGSTVTSSVDQFTVGETETSITLTVKDTDGDLVKNANVYLMWKNDDGVTGINGYLGTEFNETTGDNTAGNGKDGQYTFLIRSDDTNYPTAAPKNITVAAKWPGSNFWGYTTIYMDKNHNLMVNCTPTSAYAGQILLYDIECSHIDGGTPETYSDITIALYKENGDIVTSEDAYTNTGDLDIAEAELTLSGGVFQLYASNATHDSKGNNATITVTKYAITSSPSILAWLIDTDTNITFQVSPAANGTLTINNMSSTPNASSRNLGVADTADVDIENGIGTLEGVNATTLGRCTYQFTPLDGAARAADGVLTVTTATATPSPGTIYLNEPTIVWVTVTHPDNGVALENVRVGLDHGINLSQSRLAKLPDAKYTGSDGRVQFAITAEASGNVTIYIKNQTDADNKFVIQCAARKIMQISTTEPSANEGETFTVSAKYNGALITDATVSVTFNGVTTTTPTGTLVLTAPPVSTHLTYTITATAEGYSDDDTTIMILNVPTIFISAPTEVTAGEIFTVTVGGDDGNNAGILVTFNGVSVTTAGDGKASFTAPSEGIPGEGQVYTVTATKTGYAPATAASITVKPAGIPGFELLTLLAALGVAVILLRRRQH